MTTIVVFNLHPIVRREDLQFFYGDFGNIISIDVSYGFAMITFEDFDDAMTAIERTNGQWLDNRKLLVTLGN